MAEAVRRLAAASVDDGDADAEAPAREARLLVAAALGLDRLALITERDRPVDAAGRTAVDRLLERRVAGEPVSRILGKREFWGLDFVLGPDTLDPRPDSETVVEAALACTAARADAPLAVVDLGTGSGCLLLAILSERPNAYGIGVDRSPGAVRIASANAFRLQIEAQAGFFVGDWATALAAGSADLVVANPPYIRRDALAGLDWAVRGYDPAAALDGGTDGLDAYRDIVADLPRLLRPDGCAVLEIGHDQADAVAEIVNSAGMAVASIQPDLAGRNRAVVVRHGKKAWWKGSSHIRVGFSASV
ncbi:MAG: peptide chain release factor N(5)-glutamine methyltransferase [Rhodospirillaceae bacterium]|nr:peptide chain release factor N(5)-glutamine methyltransferase [Rhodospirillaceae bacterium]